MTTEDTIKEALIKPNPEEVGTWLREQGLMTIVVIDDLLDPLRWSDLPEETRDGFALDVERNEQLSEWLAEGGLSLPSSVASEEDEDYLSRLQDRLSENPALQALWKQHVKPYIPTDDSDVRKLVSNLKELGLTVVSGGPRNRPKLPESVSVIFLDYSLDDQDEHASINELKSIYTELEGGPLPIVVLMSVLELSEVQEQKVRDQTNTMPGMFYGFHKSKLGDGNLYLVLSIIARTLPNAQGLQLFRDAIADATMEVANQVSELVESLTLEDYALIQLLSLNSDGQPLGDYVLWLLSTYFAQQMAQNRGVRDTQARVDRMVFDTIPITNWGPSDAFARAYQSAIFAPADEDITAPSFPTLTKEALKQSGDQDKIVVLHFGDIFVEEKTKTAFMVATPECDLAFGGTRAFPEDRSVMLIPGKLVCADIPFQKGTETRLRTELFEWDENRWRIEWYIKKAKTIPLQEFKEWAEDEGIPRRRVKQIRFPFAAEIQQVYAADLTRVGVPVTPPLFQTLQATIYVATSEKKPAQICDPISAGAYVFSSPRYCKCTLNDKLLWTLRDKLPEVMERVKRMPDASRLERIPEDKLAEFKSNCETRAQKNLEEFKELAANISSFDSLRGPHKLDSPDGLNKVGRWLTITNTRPTNNYQAETILLVHLEAEDIDTVTIANS